MLRHSIPTFRRILEKMFFFYGKDKANKRSGHLMVSDYRCPRPRATPEELQMRCRPLGTHLKAGARHYLIRNAVA